MASNTAGLMNQVEKLAKNNYETWKIQMKMVLLQQNLWAYVDGTKARPEAEDRENNQAKWEEKDGKTLASIILGLVPSEICHVKNCTRSREAWENIKTVHAPKGTVSKVNIAKRLLYLKMAPSQKMQDHLNNFTGLKDKLVEYDMALPDEVLTVILLNSLPSEYEMFTVAMENRDELPKIDILTVKLLEEELRLDGKKQSGLEVPTTESQCAASTSTKSWNKPLSSAGSNKQKQSNAGGKQHKKKVWFPFRCNYCGEKGHKAADCPKKQGNKSENSSSKSESTAVVQANTTSGNDWKKDEWILDSGATSHMCNDERKFCQLEKIADRSVVLPNKQSVKIEGTGDVKILTKTKDGTVTVSLQQVLYVPGLKGNLFSVSSATEHQNKAHFEGNKAFIVNKENKTIV